MLPDPLWSQRVVEARMKAVLAWAEEKRAGADATPQERRLRTILGYLETARLRFRASRGRPKPGYLQSMLSARATPSGR